MALTEAELEKLLTHEVRYFSYGAPVIGTPFAWYLHNPELGEWLDANHALRLRDDGRGADVIADEVIAFFRSRGLTVAADVDPIAEKQGIGAALRRRGVMPTLDQMLLMHYPSGKPPALPDRGIHIRAVPNKSETADTKLWVDIVTGDDVGQPGEELWREVVRRESLFSECRLYLAELQEQPIGACDLFVADGWGRIDSVQTDAGFRRRGVASAIVARAVADSLAAGNTETYLFTEAGGAGEQVYSRLGFVPWELGVLRRHILR